jgi:hypothetical protein
MSDRIENETDKGYDFKLKSPIEYALEGDPVTATFVHFKAPTADDMAQVAPLNQAFYRAVPKPKAGERKSDDAGDAGDLTAGDVMKVLAMSADVELADVFTVSRKLFMKVATLEGDKPLTPVHFGKFTAEDFYNMVGEYMVFFVLASSLKD